MEGIDEAVEAGGSLEVAALAEVVENPEDSWPATPRPTKAPTKAPTTSTTPEARASMANFARGLRSAGALAITVAAAAAM